MVTSEDDRSNTKGEADNAIYIHAKKSNHRNIIIVASDTDLTMYGIAAIETNQFLTQNQTQKKTIVVEKEFNKNYICINTALNNFESHENVKASPVENYIGHAVLAIYILAGSDYVSNIFGIRCDIMLMTFFKYVHYISPEDDPLIIVNNGIFDKVNYIAFLRLLCCVYLEKYKKLTSHVATSPVELFNIFKSASSNMNSELKTLLEWLAYDTVDLKEKAIKISNIEDWAAFTRRVCFFMNQGSKNLYSMILPSDNSIKLHCQRGTFVMKLALDLNNCSSSFHDEYEKYGWIKYEDTIQIVWDEHFDEEEKKLNKKRPLPISHCTCKTGCNIDASGCKHCGKACRPCHDKCHCKGLCNNPHNNGGYCDHCRPAEEEEDNNMEVEEADALEAAEIETLPFEDLESYFNQQSDQFISIPTVPLNESDSESDSDDCMSEESDVEL